MKQQQQHNNNTTHTALTGSRTNNSRTIDKTKGQRIRTFGTSDHNGTKRSFKKQDH